MCSPTLYCLGEAWLTLESGAAQPAAAAQFLPRVGGAAAALATAWAHRGGSAVLLTQLGDDAFGHKIADTLAGAGVSTGQVCFTSRAPTPLVFCGADGQPQLAYRAPSAELLYAPEQLAGGRFCAGDALAFSSACLLDSPMRFAHLAALASARSAGALLCFTPCLCPALWPQLALAAQTVRAFLPRAHLVVLNEAELEPLFGTRELRVALFSLLRDHTRLVVLQTATGVHAVTGTCHAFWPGVSPTPAELTASFLAPLLQRGIGPDKLARLTQKQLASLPEWPQ